MTVAVQRLNEGVRATLVAHFLALPMKDRCLRFGASLALDVLPMHRGRGVGGALFKRAVAHARNRCIPRLFMVFRSENAPIMRIAQRFGMRVVARGGEARAHLKLQPASLSSIAVEADDPN